MRSRCVAIRVSALAVGGCSGKLPSSPGSATRRARRLRAGYGVVGQHGQEGHPRTDLVPVLLGHHPCGLSEVPQVVYHPGREQLPQRHAPQARVLTGEIELPRGQLRSEEHTSELQSQSNLVCRLLLEKKNKRTTLRLPRTDPHTKV